MGEMIPEPFRGAFVETMSTDAYRDTTPDLIAQRAFHHDVPTLRTLLTSSSTS